MLRPGVRAIEPGEAEPILVEVEADGNRATRAERDAPVIEAKSGWQPRRYSVKMAVTSFERKAELFRKLLSTLLIIGCLSAVAVTQTEESKAGQNTLSLDERLGSDDGAALAILFTANMRGNLDVCD